MIGTHQGELDRVFQSMLENAIRICDARFGMVFGFDGEAFVFAAEVGTLSALAEYTKCRGPFRPLRGSHLDRVIRTGKASHTADYAAESVAAPPVRLGGALGDLEPVFSVILENATRICRANFGVMFLVEGDAYHTAAMHNVPVNLPKPGSATLW